MHFINMHAFFISLIMYQEKHFMAHTSISLTCVKSTEEMIYGPCPYNTETHIQHSGKPTCCRQFMPQNALAYVSQGK